MTGFITKVAYSVLLVILQLVIGTLISVPVYMIAVNINKNRCSKGYINLLYIAFTSILGMMLPLNIYGIFPILIAMVKAGFPLFISFPLLLSNSLFNLSVPFTDHMFIWRSGSYRIALAFIAGVLGGLILQWIKRMSSIFLKDNFLSPKVEVMDGRSIFKLIEININAVGIYIILGVIFNVLLNKYTIEYFIEFIIGNPHMTSTVMYFTGLNVVNPIFFQSMNIVNMFMNIVFLSGLFAFLKVKAVLLYTLYFAIISGILSLSAYF